MMVVALCGVLQDAMDGSGVDGGGAVSTDSAPVSIRVIATM